MSKKTEDKTNDTHASPHENSGGPKSGYCEVKVRGAVETHASPQDIELHNAERKEDTAQKSEEYFLSQRALTVAKFACGATILYLFATILIFCETKKAADAAKSAADTANKTLIASKHSSWLDQRPWVTPIVVEAPDFTKINTPIKISLKLENSGKTPAHIVGGHFCFFAYEKGEEDDLIHPKTEGPSAVLQGGFLNPNSHITLGALFAVYHRSKQPVINTPEFIKKMNEGEIYLMGHGKVKYIDVWQVEHWIQFCNVISSEGQNHPSCTNYEQMDQNEPKQ